MSRIEFSPGLQLMVNRDDLILRDMAIPMSTPLHCSKPSKRSGSAAFVARSERHNGRLQCY